MTIADTRGRAFLTSMLLLVVFLWQPYLSASPSAGEDGAASPSPLGFKITLDSKEKAWLDNHSVLKVGGPRAFPPFHFFDENGQAQGMSFDYLHFIMEQLGLKIEVENDLPWPEVLRKATVKEIDVISCAARTPERETYLLFSTPYLSFPLVIITRKDAPFIAGIDDLREMNVALIRDNSVYEWLKRDLIDITPHFVSTPLDALKAVSLGLAEAHIENLAAASYLIEKHGLANLKVAAPTSYENYSLYFAVRKDWPELASIINKALLALSPEQHASIRNKWLSVRYEYGISLADVWKWILMTIGSASLVLVLIVLWNRRLRLEIHERRQAEDALRRSEESHRALVEGLPDIVMRFDRNGRHLFVSDNVEEILDLRPAQVIAKTHREIGFPEMQCRFWEDAIRSVFDSGTAYETEFSFEGRQGQAIFNWRLLPERDAQGMVRAVLSLCRDITARRQAEENYQTLFREMLDGFALHEIICSAEGEPTDYRFLAVNPAFERLTGLRANDIVGRTVLQILPGTERYWIETYGHVALTGDPSFFEHYAAKLDRHFEVTAFRPAPNRFACIFSDVTDRKRAEEERQKLQAQLAQALKMESVGRLAGGVAHDFNNMLGVILGHAEMAQDQVDPAQPLHANIGEIQKAARRSAELTRQLLAFARKQTISPKVLDFNETVEDMLKMLRRLIGEDIALIWRAGGNLWTVKMDPAQIDQILVNLCVNARDAISGVGKIIIETANAAFDAVCCDRHAALLPGEFVMLAVSDDGCGMDKETQERIFEPFFTTKAVGQGTGLGLATVYGIVKQNNGFIDVHSEPGRGTTFRIYIPRHQSITAPLQREASTEAVEHGLETVLLVEDEMAILNVGKAMLEGLGYRVLTANTPDEALRLAEAHAGAIHLLITDVVMPEMNGRDLAKRLHSFCPGIKRLFMSGYTADVIAHQGMLEEGVHFIQKPFSRNELAAKVREVLHEKGCGNPGVGIETAGQRTNG